MVQSSRPAGAPKIKTESANFYSSGFYMQLHGADEGDQTKRMTTAGSPPHLNRGISSVLVLETGILRAV